ncbi:adenine phosphoribosyltransferase [Inmirania thermothiophila]|uniref:Adenine phosphoribosyltransferase n=1 Tax=Inmirania thermothiophila TaxID=1750597 RepID=A0A3N1Y2B4_9GAMM|nr:adenine phosphoribosyltransferase [Inmirania thermothiophila]ROR32658.1 adenine phosphoribosyltransferase [Inmirania thermothiophila]
MDGGDPAELARRCRALIRDIPDFPKPGIVFRDITPLLGSGPVFGEVVDALAAICRRAGWRPDAVVCPEARGFLFGAPLAYRLGVGLVPVRKPDKLPHETRRIEYQLEYGSDAVEIHADALTPGRSVVLVDDLIATGGTLGACATLLTEHGVEVLGALCLVELDGLGGRGRLAPVPLHSIVHYPS